MNGLPQDVRLAFRGVRRRPAFAATVVLTIALGIAWTTTIFSVVHCVLIRPLPYPDADRLITVSVVREGASDTDWGETSPPGVADVLTESRSVTELVGYGPATATLTLWSGRFLSGVLFGVTPADPWTAILALVVLVVTVVGAMSIPARRAGRVDPTTALRGD